MSETSCPKCGNEMVYRVPSPAKVLECVHCSQEIQEVTKPTAIHRASWDLSIAIANGEEVFDYLMNFAEAIKNSN